MKIRLVVATRASQELFVSETATGKTTAFSLPNIVEYRIFPDNKQGLPAIYNKIIREAQDDPATLVFAHDDLHMLDYFWWARIKEGLSKFDIIGVAGNQRRLPKQSSWAFIDDKETWDDQKNLSGVIGGGNGFPPSSFHFFGPPRRQVKLLDGLLLAAESETLLKNNLFFDEQFDFHFYDMDFCRQAETKNLRCGTWDISLVHESGGDFKSESWARGYKKYLDKWGE
ncbi:MAG: glycosyltransferase [Chitinivorax sp.]